MPFSYLRHAFSDTVADVDGFIVRTRLGSPTVAKPATSRQCFAESSRSPESSSAVKKTTTAQQQQSTALATTGSADHATGSNGGGNSYKSEVKGERSRSNLSEVRQTESDGLICTNEASTSAVDYATWNRDVGGTVTRPPTTGDAVDRVEFKESQPPERVCTISCCCCTGKLLLMWLQV